MSSVVFLLVPLMSGLVVAARRPLVILASLVLMKVLLVLFAFAELDQPLIAAGLVTLSVSAPCFVVGLLVGTWWPPPPKTGALGMIFLCNAVVLGLAAGNQRVEERKEEVRTAVWVMTNPQPVWDSLKTFGALSGERGLLMRLGMPTPLRCSLESEGVGAVRVCHFDQGQIEQRVRVWEPPLRMGLQIVASDLPLQLFTFTSASYELSAKNDQTQVVRTTEFSSHLLPSWFWRPLEQMTVEEEHHYLLTELQSRFNAQAPSP